MSGSSSSRSDWTPGSGGGGAADTCSKVRRGPINSPKAVILAPLKVGSVLGVQVQTAGARPVLVVVDAQGNLAGALTFVGYLEIIECIQIRNFKYQAVITSITSGVYEVRVEPI